MLSTYFKFIQKHPLFTKMALASVLMGVGDVSAQLIEARKQISPGTRVNVTQLFAYVDGFRTARMIGISAFIMTPVLHKYFKLLDQIVPGRYLLVEILTDLKKKLYSSITNTTVMKKLAVDQFIFAPLSVGSFISMVAVSEGKNASEIADRLKTNYVTTMKANYALWPFANYVNLRFIPLEHRVVFSSGLGLIWNVILSTLSNREAPAEVHSEQQQQF